MITFWNRLVNMDNNRLTKKIFMHDFNLCKDNWSSEIKTICSVADHNHFFNNIQIINPQQIENCLKVNQTETWLSELPNKPKLRTYVTFKNLFETETYVIKCYSRRKRSLLAQLRMGVLPLAIETGRFKGIPSHERFCKVCPNDIGLVEDELHFLCSCLLYHETRQSMYNNVINRITDFSNMSREEKFVYLIQNEWKEVANFLDKAWNLRSQKLYN